MEEILIVVLQIVVEIFIQVPWDCAWSGDKRGSAAESAMAIVVFSPIAGGLLALMSLFLFPGVLTPWPWLRCLQLVAFPMIAGCFGFLIASWRDNGRRAISPTGHFWMSALFSFGYLAVRFAYAHRL